MHKILKKQAIFADRASRGLKFDFFRLMGLRKGEPPRCNGGRDRPSHRTQGGSHGQDNQPPAPPSL